MKYITAEGPSYEWHTGQYRLAGHTYPAPHEPVGVPLVELRKHDWAGIEITRNTPDSTYEVLKLTAQLETARKALEGLQWNADPIIRAHVMKALAQIGAGQKGGK